MTLTELFENPMSQKTASQAAPAAAAPSGKTAVAQAIEEAMEAAQAQSQQAKVASQQPTPGSDLEKLARDVSNKNRENLIKEASDIGRAIADGFMAQVAVYEKVAAQMQPSEPTETEKRAAYDEAAQRLTEEIHAIGADHYLGGYKIASALVEPSK